MKFGVVVFPGTYGDDDLVYVLQHLMQRETFKLWHKDTDLNGIGPGDCIILPGGASYGDHLRPGAIARFSPIMESVLNFAMQGGFVWGIGNGFQILCEAGLLPGALLENKKGRFICKNVHLKAMTSHSPLTSNILNKEKPLRIPIAHGKGRFYVDDQTLSRLEQNDQVLFKYCNENGEVLPEANPDGSLNNIAGVCNARRNVFGLMPHPERAADEELGNTEGRILFESLIHTATNLVEN